MPMTQQEMVKLLISIGGLKVKGGKGSHIKVKLPGVNRPIIVPSKLPRGTEHAILRQAGLKSLCSCFLREEENHACFISGIILFRNK